jgi:hypothetical protein
MENNNTMLHLEEIVEEYVSKVSSLGGSFSLQVCDDPLSMVVSSMKGPNMLSRERSFIEF